MSKNDAPRPPERPDRLNGDTTELWRYLDYLTARFDRHEQRLDKMWATMLGGFVAVAGIVVTGIVFIGTF